MTSYKNRLFTSFLALLKVEVQILKKDKNFDWHNSNCLFFGPVFGSFVLVRVHFEAQKMLILIMLTQLRN